MISALRGYSESQPTPPDATSVTITANYLEACNLIFERGNLQQTKSKRNELPGDREHERWLSVFCGLVSKAQRER